MNKTVDASVVEQLQGERACFEPSKFEEQPENDESKKKKHSKADSTTKRKQTNLGRFENQFGREIEENELSAIKFR